MDDVKVSVQLSQLEKWLNCLSKIVEMLDEIEKELASAKEKHSLRQGTKILGLHQAKTSKRY